MTALRNLSPRPELLVPLTQDPSGTYQVGANGPPLGRNRVVSALPLQDGPRQLVAPQVVHAPDLSYLADPQGNLLGVPGVRVSRIITATRTAGTRRF